MKENSLISKASITEIFDLAESLKREAEARVVKSYLNRAENNSVSASGVEMYEDPSIARGRLHAKYVINGQEFELNLLIDTDKGKETLLRTVAKQVGFIVAEEVAIQLAGNLRYQL